MSRMLSIVAGMLALLGLVGCAAPVKHLTPSGKPEVTIQGTTPSKVGAYLTNEMLNLGYNITKQSDFLLSFDRPVDNAFAAAMLGSKYDSTPNARVSYTMAEVSGATRVVADLRFVTNPGSAFERFTDAYHNADSKKFQGLLDQAKANLQR